ncbi:MAG: penicillin-binding protein 2 [Clostridia bacterium]|nr:penicillin-binding protein 2 [Clostridia bacterium]
MKQQRRQFKFLAVLMFSLFLVLAFYGGYSVIQYGNRWFSSSRNPRVRSQKENVMAGDILDRNGIILAYTDTEGERHYQAEEASRRAVVHVLGDRQGQVANGVESFQTAYLYGFQSTFPELVRSFLSGESRRGDDITLTLDSRLCTQMMLSFDAHEKTRGLRGAAVVMNYRTGELLGEISLPNFDPDRIDEAVYQNPGQPFWNRATQSIYPPGSTFKTITAAAALMNLPDIENEQFTCTGELPVDNGFIHDFGNARHGKLSFQNAYRVSCNQVFAQVALRMGDQELKKAAEKAGFNDNFLFRDLVVENSTYPADNRTEAEVAASGFGQSAVAATPLHMCMVAASVANGGVMMEPILLREVRSTLGDLRYEAKTRVYTQAMEAWQAEILDGYMRDVVVNGTGSRASVSGLTVCGKTGTADSTQNGEPISYGWFIGYLREESLPYAVCVLVEDVASGDGGGSTAAPIAADIFAYLRDHDGK